jgi:transposase
MNADETSWRVNGQNHWLWVFTNKDTALYQIDKSRGSKVVRDILGERYRGVLISDFIRLITNFRPWLASVA